MRAGWEGALRYLVRRLSISVVTLAAVSVGTFGLFFAIPADPAALQCGQQCTPAQHEQVRHTLGLDRPLPEQYVEFMAGIVAGRTITTEDTVTECSAPCLGYSFRTFEPVTDMIARSLPITMSLVVGAAVLWLTLGIAIGILAASRQGTWIDRAAIGTAVAAASTQTFFVGLMLQVVFVYWLGWLPLPSYTSPFDDPQAWFTGLLLPWITLASLFAAAYARFTRAELLNTFSEDFVLVARAKGLPKRSVVRHSLRASMMPIVTIAGLDVGALLGGAAITETVFGLPGIGNISVQATQELNLPVVMGTVLLAAFFVVMANLVTDLLYVIVDPRVRLR